MYRKALILAVLMSASISSGLSQTKASAFGVDFEIIETEKKQKPTLPIGAINRVRYAHDDKGKLYKYSKSGEIAVTYKALKMAGTTKLKGVSHFEVVGDRLINVVSHVDKATDQLSVYVIEHDTESLVESDAKKIASVPYERKRRSTYYSISDPENKDAFGVVMEEDKDGSVAYTIYILNNKIEVETERSFDLNAEYNSTNLFNFSLDDSFISFVLKEEGDKGEKDKVNFHLLGREVEDHIDLPIELNDLDHDISDFECAINEDGNLFVSGFYLPNREEIEDRGGAFTQIYDLSSEKLINQAMHPFDFEFITENLSEKSKEKAEKKEGKGKKFQNPYQYLVRNVIPHEDGSSTMLGELYRYYVTSQTNSKGQTTFTDHYIHADLIIMRTNSEGEIEWVERFKKFHHGINNHLEGPFLMHHDEEDIYIVYMHGVGIKKGELRLGKISIEDGDSESEKVFDKEEDFRRYYVQIGSAAEMSSKSYSVPIVRRGNSKELKIMF